MVQNQNSNKPAWESAGKTDSIMSTFKHIAWQNSKKKGVIPITGYSKPFLGVEGPDKTKVLEKELCRLFSCGYVFGVHHKYGDPTICMEVFENGKRTFGKDVKIVTLYPKHYELDRSNEDWIENFRFTGFLKRVYDQIKDQGTLDLSKLIHKGVLTSRDKLFDTSKARFKKLQELYDYCENLRKDGHEPRQVYAFMLKYQTLHSCID